MTTKKAETTMPGPPIQMNSGPRSLRPVLRFGRTHPPAEPLRWRARCHEAESVRARRVRSWPRSLLRQAPSRPPRRRPRARRPPPPPAELVGQGGDDRRRRRRRRPRRAPSSGFPGVPAARSAPRRDVVDPEALRAPRDRGGAGHGRVLPERGQGLPQRLQPLDRQRVRPRPLPQRRLASRAVREARASCASTATSIRRWRATCGCWRTRAFTTTDDDGRVPPARACRPAARRSRCGTRGRREAVPGRAGARRGAGR